MSPMDTILGRIKKLLALTVDRGATPEEAASAAAKAQALLFEHNLSMSTVETHEVGSKAEEIEDIEMEIEGGSASIGWKRRLLHAVAKNNFCSAVTMGGTTTVNVVGKRSNVIVVEYMSEYLEGEIQRLAKHAAASRLNDNGKARFINNFCTGAVETIRERLDAQMKSNEQANAASTALVVQSKGEIERAFKKFHPFTVKGGRARVTDGGAFHAGKQAGHGIGLNKGIGSRQSAQAQLV